MKEKPYQKQLRENHKIKKPEIGDFKRYSTDSAKIMYVRRKAEAWRSEMDLESLWEKELPELICRGAHDFKISNDFDYITEDNPIVIYYWAPADEEDLKIYKQLKKEQSEKNKKKRQDSGKLKRLKQLLQMPLGEHTKETFVEMHQLTLEFPREAGHINYEIVNKK